MKGYFCATCRAPLDVRTGWLIGIIGDEEFYSCMTRYCTMQADTAVRKALQAIDELNDGLEDAHGAARASGDLNCKGALVPLTFAQAKAFMDSLVSLPKDRRWSLLAGSPIEMTRLDRSPTRNDPTTS
jgi:hypothetical protein